MTGSVGSKERDTVGIGETTETWVRIDLFCDGLENDGACPFGAGGEPEKISDVAPTSDGARKAILNAAAKACWHLDPKSRRWLCPDCAGARDASKHPESLGMSDGPPPLHKRAAA